MGPRPRTTSPKDLAALVRQEPDWPPPERLPDRPRGRGACTLVPRPCPFVSCRHNNFLEVTRTGGIKFTWPERDVLDVPPGDSCSLDRAERGAHTLDEVGALLRMTREGVRLIETRGLVQIRRHAERLDTGSQRRKVRAVGQLPKRRVTYSVWARGGKERERLLTASTLAEAQETAEAIAAAGREPVLLEVRQGRRVVRRIEGDGQRQTIAISPDAMKKAMSLLASFHAATRPTYERGVKHDGAPGPISRRIIAALAERPEVREGAEAFQGWLQGVMAPFGSIGSIPEGSRTTGGQIESPKDKEKRT